MNIVAEAVSGEEYERGVEPRTYSRGVRGPPPDFLKKIDASENAFQAISKPIFHIL